MHWSTAKIASIQDQFHFQFHFASAQNLYADEQIESRFVKLTKIRETRKHQKQ